MNNLILTTNIVLPIFLIMVVGFCCRRFGLVSEDNVKAINKLVFRVFLPCSLCKSLMNIDPDTVINPTVLAFGSGGIFVTFLCAYLLIPHIEKDNTRRGVMIQGIFRSNFAIFGIPMVEALYPQGDGGISAMMVIATVPLFNALAVFSLERFRGGKADFGKILKGIAKNPLIWACIVGFAISQLRIPLPQFVSDTVSKLGTVASPLALFALGGTINLQTFMHNIKPLSICVSGRLVFAPLVLLSIALLCGIRGPEFACLIMVFVTPCAVSSFTMASQMGGDAELAAQQVMMTTVMSAVTMFLMIFLFKSTGVI